MNLIPYTIILEVYFDFNIQRALIERADKINPTPTTNNKVDLEKLESSNKQMLDAHLQKITSLFKQNKST